MAYSIMRFDMRSPDFSSARTDELYSAALDMAQFVDQQGFHMITLSEHHGTDDGYLPSPLPLAGCMVGRTRRVSISVVALLLPLYDPLKLAEDLAVLDIASGGRVSIVAGLGYRPEEYEMLGREFERRGALMDKGLELLIRAWSGEPFEHEGRRIHLTPRPLTQPRPPVLVGGMSRLGARRAARFGLPFQPAVDDPDVIGLYHEECERLGVADPLVLPPGSGEMIWVSKDPDRTWSLIGPHLLHEARTYASWQPANQSSVVHSKAETVEALRAEGKYRVLTPDECVARASEHGPLASFVLFPLCGGIPPEIAWEGLELYANEVMPRFAAAG